MKPEIPRKAAKWWADHIRNGCKMDNGANDPANVMARMLGEMIQRSRRSKIPADKIDAYEAALAARFETIADRGYGVQLGDVDYHPHGPLTDAAADAGIDVQDVLPIKSSVIFRDGQLHARLGYGAEPVIL